LFAYAGVVILRDDLGPVIWSVSMTHGLHEGDLLGGSCLAISLVIFMFQPVVNAWRRRSSQPCESCREPPRTT
jgi:hypothetical protein